VLEKTLDQEMDSFEAAPAPCKKVIKPYVKANEPNVEAKEPFPQSEVMLEVMPELDLLNGENGFVKACWDSRSKFVLENVVGGMVTGLTEVTEPRMTRVRLVLPPPGFSPLILPGEAWKRLVLPPPRFGPLVRPGGACNGPRLLLFL